MPAMSRVQSMFCQSRPWRAVAGKGVLPWSLQGFEPTGEVLEIGAGSGAMAAALLAAEHDGNGDGDLSMTVTDFDEEMVATARRRLAPYEGRVTVQQADATALPFPDASFDAVLSWVMLHHTVAWETALSECVRVLRPGGHLVGYDLLSTPPLRLLHRRHGDHLRLIRLGELRAVVQDLAVDPTAVIRPSAAGLFVRFHLRKLPALGAG
jgi:ubiquinone/menaquinone biosynthesis C-methylase UbiE